MTLSQNINLSTKLTLILTVVIALSVCSATTTLSPTLTSALATASVSLPTATPLSQATSAAVSAAPSLLPTGFVSPTPPAKDNPLELVGHLAGLGHKKPSGSGAFDIAGDILYLVAHETDLRIIDIADPTQPREIGLYQTNIPILKVVVSDRYIFMAGTDATLQILDRSDPLKLREIGLYHLPLAGIEDLAINDNTLYLAAGENGLRIMDISTPTNPIEIGRYEVARAYKLVMADHTLHLLGNEWLILDITNPAAPQRLVVNQRPGWREDITVAGQYAYFHTCPDYNIDDLAIVDISNPAAPVRLEPEYEYRETLGTSPGGRIGIAGQYLFDISSAYIRIIDLSSVTRPITIGEYRHETAITSFKIIGDDTLYVSGQDGELWIFRTRSIALPQSTARVTCPNYLGSGIGSVFIRDRYAYVGSGPRLSILDVSNPGRPVEVGHTVLLGQGSYIKDIAVTDSLAYLASGDGLRIVDVSNVTAPVQLNFTPLPGQGVAISAANGYAYVTRNEGNGRSGSGCCNGGKLHILDVSNPLAPQVVNTFKTASGGCNATYRAYEVMVSNNYAYVADSDEYGLRILDVSNPAQPVELGNSGGWAEDVVIKDGYAYVSNGYWRDFRIIDISDPTSLKQVAGYETPNSTGPLAMVDQIIYLTEGTEWGLSKTPEVQYGLRLLDVSNPISPTNVGFYPTSGAVQDIMVANGYAYLVSGGQLHILDVSEPTAPIEVGVYGRSYTFNHFTPAGEHLYLADNGENELQLIDPSQSLTPTLTAAAVISSETLLEIISRPPYAYAVEKQGLRIFSLADPSTLTELSFYPMEAAPLIDAAIAGDYAYLLNSGDSVSPPGGDTLGLTILDLSTPTKPGEVGHYALPSGVDRGMLAQTKDYLLFHYQNDDKETMWVLALSLTNPITPTEISRLKVTAGDLTVRGNYAYIANVTKGLQVLELLAETKSIRVRRFPELTGHSLVFKGDYAYLVTETEGLRLLDLSDPMSPVEVGAAGLGLKGTDWGYSLKEPTIGADYAYLIGDDNRFHVIDISEPTTPREAGYSFFPDTPQTITLVDDYSYITDDYGDLFICQVEQIPPSPAVTPTSTPLPLPTPSVALTPPPTKKPPPSPTFAPFPTVTPTPSR